jgi:hypothetical protein
MRRTIGTVLSGLGMFLIVFALLLRFYVVGVAVKFPLNTYTISTLVGHDVSYFSTSKLTELSGVTMKVTNTTKGEPADGNSSRAVYDSFTYIYDQTDKATFQYSSSRMAFNRKTGVLINCCGASVSGKKVHMSGLGVLWPLGTKKQNYQVFNTTLNKPVTARYEGQGTVDGLSAYKFVTKIPLTKFGTEQVPGALIGSTAATVTLGEYLQSTVTDWVNPATGVPLTVTESPHIGLYDAAGTERLVVFNGTMSTTPGSVRSAANTVKKNLVLLNAITTIGPLTAGILGLILLVVGILLVVRGRREQVEESYEGSHRSD